jgi:hypothetical protein
MDEGEAELKINAEELVAYSSEVENGGWFFFKEYTAARCGERFNSVRKMFLAGARSKFSLGKDAGRIGFSTSLKQARREKDSP